MSKGRTRRQKTAATREYTGTVILEPVYLKSKSERLAVKLDTGERKYLLRRPGIRSYRDEELEALVGQTIKCRCIKRGIRLYLLDFE